MYLSLSLSLQAVVLHTEQSAGLSEEAQGKSIYLRAIRAPLGKLGSKVKCTLKVGVMNVSH